MNETMHIQERTNAAQAYEAPQVEIIEVAVEKGYADSDDVNAEMESFTWH